MLLLPQISPVFQLFQQMGQEKRVVFFAGIPGVGKSLWLQQFTQMAHQQGRIIHTLQWDVARLAFETPNILATYPEVDGVTHAGIRKAVGLWARDAIWHWHTTHPNPNHILIGELPLIGNRLIELMQKQADAVEPLLASDQTLCIVPVPSLVVRQTIEAKRAQSIATPQNERETKDAPPNVLQLLWQEVAQLDSLLVGQLVSESHQPTNQQTNIPYSPQIYTRVFNHLLQHRHKVVLNVDEVYATTGSVYEGVGVVVGELIAGKEKIAGILTHLQTTYTPQTLQSAVANWYQL